MAAMSILIPLYTIPSRSDMQDAGHKFSLVAALSASRLGISNFISVITTSKSVARVDAQEEEASVHFACGLLRKHYPPK